MDEIEDCELLAIGHVDYAAKWAYAVANLLHRQARKKAKWLVDITQGTMSLEAQGMDQETYDALVEKTYRQIMRGDI